jgi:hypothetical protein
MHQVVIFFIPIRASQQDVETALRKCFPSLETDRVWEQTAQRDWCTEENLPLWTWFLPNPCP